MDDTGLGPTTLETDVGAAEEAGPAPSRTETVDRRFHTFRRCVGAALVILTAFPFYRLLLLRETGLAGEATAVLSETTAGVLWFGTLLALVPAIILARVVRPTAIEERIASLGDRLAAPRTHVFAMGVAVLAGGLTLGFSLLVLEGKPNLIDAMAQLVHARYIAAGKLAGPIGPEGAFWHIQNTVVTPNGWVSQYPPGHVLLLAIGFKIGAVWAVGPFLAAVTVFFTALGAERLLSEDRRVARLGAVLVAVSPFLIGLAGAYMNHVAAAAFGTMAIYFALRARDGHGGWALATGIALAWAFGTRPLAGLVFGAVVAFGVWLPNREFGRFAVGQWMRRFVLACLGALPFILALGAYNQFFFGSPLRFGYTISHGDTTSLGFHRDPWGNWYGPIEALLYTSSDLLALSLNLLETPVPATILVGVYILIARRLSPGEVIIAAWALLPVLANAFYWHHGLFMGPRMLNEFVPAWGLLAAAAAVGVVRETPRSGRLGVGKYSIRTGVLTLLLAGGAIGFLTLAPQRMAGYSNFMSSSRIQPPEADGPALVFVHGGWTGRPGMLLAAGGMRLDSVETALRQNSTCRVHHFAVNYVSSSGQDAQEIKPVLDFEPRSRGFPPEFEISPGNRIRVEEGEQLTEDCRREILADRNGIIDVAPLLWQGDLPGLPASGPLFVRDMGPEMNARLIRRFPDRRPLVLRTPDPMSPPVLEEYEAGMTAIWGGTN